MMNVKPVILRYVKASLANAASARGAMAQARGQVCLAIVAAALAMTAMIPNGHMVTIGQDFSIAVTPCPGTNALARAFATARVDSDAAAHGNHHDGHHAGHDMAHSAHDAHGAHTSHSSHGSHDPSAGSSSADCDLGTSGLAAPPSFATTVEPLDRAIGPVQPAALRYLALAARSYERPPLRAPPTLS